MSKLSPFKVPEEGQVVILGGQRYLVMYSDVDYAKVGDRPFVREVMLRGIKEDS